MYKNQLASLLLNYDWLDFQRATLSIDRIQEAVNEYLRV